MSQGVKDPKSRVISDARCHRCGGRERYRSNRGCVTCVKRRAARKLTPTATAAVADPMEGLL
jgi:hypothetical protein